MTEDGITPTPPAKPDDRLTTDAPAPHGPFRGSALRSGLVPGASTALGLLLAINMFNYIDRYVLAAVLTPIRDYLFPNDRLDQPLFWLDGVDFRMGMLATAFMGAFMLMAPVFGKLADHLPRWKLMAFGVAVWSLASGASGLATSYLGLFLTRLVVGTGEAAYGPAAPAVLSDMYPPERRGTILSYFYAAIPVGSALGYILGGLVTHWTGDWRWAFFVVVPPGLLLALLCLFIREPVRGQCDVAAKPHSAGWADYLIILKTPSFVLCTLGYTATTFAVGGVATWMPDYLIKQRHEGDIATINTTFGGITVVAGLLATLAGGWTADALRKRFPGSYFLVSGAGMLLAFPLMISVLIAPYPWDFVLIFLTVFCLFFNTGPINTIVANVTHPAVRASAFALVILVIHLFGDTFSPPMIGMAADQARAAAAAGPKSWWTDFLGSCGGWDFSFCVVSLTILLAAVFWLWGARYLARDTALAPTRVAAPHA